MASLIAIYMTTASVNGTVTKGGANGSRVSEGTEANPITVGPLDTTLNEVSAPVMYGIRCDEGYVAAPSAMITPTGDGYDGWALAPNVVVGNVDTCGTFGEWGAPLTFPEEITDVNTVFWAKARAVSAELPINDKSVDLVVTATISAAE